MILKNTLKKFRSFFLATFVLCSIQIKLNAQTAECLNFDGGNDYIQLPSQNFGTNWSVEAWVRPTNATSIIWNTVLGQAYWNGLQGFAVAIQSGSVFVNSPQGVIISTPITNGIWTHIAVTYNNGIFAFYKNGLLVGNQIIPFTNSTAPFFIGGRNNNNVSNNSSMVDFFNGNIDEIRLWNNTRSQCDIMSYMNCEIPTTAAGLMANYHFNQALSGALSILNSALPANFDLNDATGNGNTGSLTNFGLNINGSSNWVAGGAVTSGFSTPTVSTPEINIKGNAVNITDGDVSSSTLDFTDFNGQPTRTFVIESLGSSTLNVGIPVFTGANASDFSVTVAPVSALAASTGSTSFVIAFTPTSVGTKSAIVNIYNSDCSEPIYDFVITATAVTGSALNFDGVNDYVETGANLAELGQGDFTIEAWIKTTATSQGIVTCANANATWETGEKSFYLDAAGTPMFVGWGNNYIVGNVAVNNGAWHHVAVVWDYNGGIGSFGKMYVDGVDHTAGSSYAGNNTNIGTFKIGKQNYGAGEAPNNFNGSIDEVRIWDRALCLPEIIHNMTCELPSPASQLDLNGYYQFNSGVAFGTNTAVTTASDAAVFTNNGTLTNFTLTGGTTSNWVSPGGVTNGSNCAVYLYPEINIQGNATSINSGDMTPSLTDHSDFGYVNLGSTLSRTFVIQNTGTAALSISAYSLSGANAGDFTITTNPGASVPAAGNTSIVISFSASVTGLKTASLTITSNDCDEGVYRFVINATGVVPGAALKFDGLNDYVQMSDPNFGTSDCTIEAWFNPSAGGGYLITTRTFEAGPGGNWWALVIGTGTNSGVLSFELAASTSTYAVISTLPGNFSMNTWNHLAVVRSGSLINIYINGILKASAIEPVTRNFVTGNNILRLGGWVDFNAAWYNGSLDEVRLWNVARTQCEIQSNMNCEIPSTASNLVGNYHFNQGYDAVSNPTITTVTDVSGSGRTGSIINSALSGTASNWVAPGGVVSGYTTTAPPVAEIDVRGNGNSIIDGNTGTSAIDFTDFNGANTRTFTIHNTIGGGTLNIGNLFLTGADASQFAITTLPSSSLVGVGSSSFVVVFTPTSTGVKSATININNNDCSEPLYDFVITATAVAGGVLTFDGVDDYAQIPSVASMSFGTSTDLSAEAMVKFTSNHAGFHGVIAKGDPGGGWYGVQLAIVQNKIAAEISSNSGFVGTGQGLIGSTILNDGIWHHLALVVSRSNNIAQLYVDGLLEASVTNPFLSGNINSAASTFIGTERTQAGFFDGEMDEVRIWNTTRTQCEIQAYKDCEIATTASGLIVNYHFNQGIAGGNNPVTNIVTDAAGSNTASVINFSLSGLSSNWTSPGAVVSGYTTTSAPTATLTVYGNGNTVPMGATTSTTNYTDFDLATNRTFLIHNLGISPLYVNSITFSGANASNFSVTSLPSASIAGSANSPFIISFTPTAVGSQSAIVNISSNDCTNPTFSFVITASTSPASALAFDGANDYVEAPHIAAIMINSVVTVEAWAKPATNSGIQYIVSKGTNDLTDGQYGIVLINGVPQYHLYNGGHIGVTAVNYTATPGVWAHYAGTWDGNTLKLYINGLLNASGTYTGTMPANTGALQIGRLSPGGYWSTASIDEVRIWNIARTQCEIQTFMNVEIPSTASGLMANYHFNHGIPSGSNSTYTVLTDASANNNHGVLYNMTLNGSSSNWVAPSSISNGFTTAVAPTATIAVSGNGNNIPQSTATFGSNNTDFGTNAARTFSIYNAGTGTLNINTITFTGPNAAQFSVTTPPASSLTTGGSSFVITLTPTNTGISTATVNISSNDCTNPTYSFVITGSTSPASALDFDNSNDYVDLGNGITTLFDPLNTITLEAWVKPTSTVGLGSIVGNWQSPVSVMQFLLQRTGDRYSLHIDAGAGYITLTSAPNTATTNIWQHVAGVWDGSQMRLYINGVLQGILANTGSSFPTRVNNVMIGGNNVNEQLTGSIDEVRIWTVARTQCEILTYMNCEIPTTSPGLLANYHFNQGIPSGSNTAVTTLTDATGAYTGTLTNFSLTGAVSNWVSPSAVVNNFTTAVIPTASMSITGNGNPISAGSTAPLLSNFTDFGTTSTRTFVIQRTGSGTLYVNSPVTLTGANASDFSITTQPSSSVTTGTTNFVVNFVPTALGTRSAMVVVNSSDCGTPNYSFVITATAVPGAALNFDGIDDFVDCGTSTNLDISIGTWEAWVNLSTLATNSRIFFKENADGFGSGTYESYYLAANGKFQADIKIGASNYSVTSVTSPLTNTWYHVAVTFDGLSLKMYVNGILEATNALTIGAMSPGTGHLSLGASYANPASSPLTGNVDEARLWNRALCQNEIQAQMNCELTGSEPGLILYYKLNAGIANGVNTGITTVIDVAGGDNTGTLTNSSLSGLNSNWVAPGAVISGSSCAVFTAPEINLVSNATTILDGDNTPSITDNTDFGNISSTGIIVKTYTLQNTGASNLAVTSITMSGADASSYTVGTLSPASPVTGGSSAVFSITFAPTSAGTKSATVNVMNNDCDEAIYDFVVTGTSTVGAAFTFDGTDDYINCGNILTASYTKEAWVKINTSTNGNNLLSSGSGTIGTAFWAPGIYGYKLSAGHNNTWAAVQDPTALSFGTWYHIAVTYDAPSLTMILYKNGTAVSTNTNVLPFTGTSPLHIGAFDGTFVTTGSMDEVRIWNRPLCQAEIQNNMNCEIPTTASGLIANYHFNQGVANGLNTAITSLTDASGSANNGTLTNIAGTGTISNWVAVGGVSSGSSCAAYFTPEINLIGNTQSINDGDMTPTSSDHTDFGGVCVNGQVVRTFTIQNTGTANLSVSSITVGGVNASLSSIGPLTPASPIAPGNSAIFSVSFSPTSAGVKTTTLYITNSDCNEGVYDFAMTGTCNALPTVTASSTNSVICEGASTTLNGLGADTYTWTGSVVNGVSFTPSITLTYSVTGTNTLTGCTSTNNAAQTITVNINPTVTANAVNTVICEGATTTLTALGTASYTWNPGAINNFSISTSPSITTSYSVVGSSTAGCTSVNTVVITVSVNALPTVTALTSNSVVCLNFTTSLNGLGADTYTWTGGVTNGVAFAPTGTQTYSVTGTNTLSGCISTNVAVQTITVDPLPTVSISISNSVICEGNSATLTASGANTYTWNPGSLSGISISPSPTLFTTYTLSGTSAAGCTNTNLAIQSISVNTLPTVSAGISSSIICAGNTITLNGSGATTYTWTGGAPDGTAFSPTATTTYTLSGTNSAGCTNTNLAVASVTVNALPQLSVTASSFVLCLGDQTTLNGSGASTYTWSGGITNNQAFTPTSTATYTLSGTDGNSCENTTITTITVNNLPQLNVSSTSSIACEAQTTTLTVSGAATYSWNTGETTTDVVITPTATSIFTINATDANNCTNFIVYTQSVAPCPGTFSAWTSQGNVSCAGKNDGYIAVKYSSSYPNAQVSYVWANSNVCTDVTCDSIVKLDAGTYSVTVKFTYTLNSILVKTDSVILGSINILDENGQCEVKIFSGITANNDGINDVLTIENIEQFPNNSVSVYNRWGQLVFEKKGYNNTNTVWPVGDEGSKLISNTYFYVIDLGNGSKLIKGWIELIKN